MKKYILPAAAAILLIACNTEDNNIVEPVAAQINATIGGSTLSRARDITWESGDYIGISMSGRYINMKYITENGNGTFTGSTMYFKNKVEPVSICAYYPYAGTENEMPAVIEASTDAERQTADEQSKYDFLYAFKENVTGAQPVVNLQFSHKMSKLTLILKNGNDGTDVSKIISYTIEGLIHQGTFNPATGVCAAKPEVDATPLTITPVSVQHANALPSLLLFPQAVNKVTLKIKDSEDQDYLCELKFGNNCLESGNNYQFTINVSKTGLSVSSSIANWETVGLKGDAMSDD